MTIRRVEIERFSAKSSKPFDLIVAALEAAVGHPDIGKFFKDTNAARTFAELEGVVNKSLLAPYGNADTLKVAQALDSKIEALLEAAAG